jgi:hypothetical protein
MMFLLKVAFWLSLAIILLPTGGTQPAASGPQVGAAEAVSAASAAVADMRHFCARQPDACAVGAQAAVTFGYKAQAGAKMLYEFLNEKLAPAETGSVTPGTAPSAAGSAKPSQTTLTPADLAPDWHVPQARKEAQARRAG